MGGHGHHDPYTVPDAKIYNVADAPKLAQIEQALARRGLKDPWLRNEVWRYNKQHFGTHSQRVVKLFFKGFPLGFAAFALTIGAEMALSKDDGHGHGDHH